MIEITETSTQYKLAEYECWLIFKKRVSANERLLALDLEKIGKEIVKKCKRVPWAAEFLGRIMYFIHDKGEWLSIQNNKIWDLLDNKNNGALHILKLGYDHLQTPSLKQCFAYCAIFPKDYIMIKDEVIQYWMAEGLLEPSKEGNKVMEDIGNMYFNILLATSFFQNAREDAYGDIISCKMHNLVHDFAISISKSEILILEGDYVDNVSKVQPLFVRSDGEKTPRTSFSGDSFIKMRTLISKNLDFDDMLSNFKCLRVLQLFGHRIIGLPNSIEQLMHLRLLHILHAEITELPKSITKLYNLQTLRIEACPKFMELPEDLSNLINLRHISINNFCGITQRHRDGLLKNMGRLTCLQTLKFFYVGQNEGYRIKEMGPLKNLRGEIDIYNLEKVKDEEEAKSAKLKEKEIFKLGLFWSNIWRELDVYNKDEKVLEGLHPHPNLKSLTIEWYRGRKFPSWVNDLSLFHNLIHIKLNSCMECEQVPTLGQLLTLRVLEIQNILHVRRIGSEFYSYSDGSNRNTTLFPALRILNLEWMYMLEEWKDAKELTSAGEVLLVFPCLEELSIKGCNKLRYLPNSLYTCVSLQNFVVENCLELRSLPGVPSVKHLEIIRCGIEELPSGGLQFCTSLQYLEIRSCSNLKSIVDTLHTCVSLKKLVVQDCPKLRSLPGVPSVIQHLEIIRCGIDELPSGLQSCASLRYLDIRRCRNLKSIPDLGEVFHSLINLKLSNCPDVRLKLSRREDRLKTLVIGGFIEELDAFPIRCYPSIRYSYASLKKLYCLGGLHSLPNEIQHFTALEVLRIENFNGMEALPDWFSYLSSLQNLSLFSCEKLMCLPILHLTNLKHLHIAFCPNLEERYAEGSGVEWFQIAHVPNIRINGKYIQGKDSEDSDNFDSFDFEDVDFDLFDW